MEKDKRFAYPALNRGIPSFQLALRFVTTLKNNLKMKNFEVPNWKVNFHA